MKSEKQTYTFRNVSRNEAPRLSYQLELQGYEILETHANYITGSGIDIITLPPF